MMMDNNASSEAKMQRAIFQVTHSFDNYDLTISTKKTDVVHHPAPGKPYNESFITENGQKPKVVDKFTYLGSTFSRAVHTDYEVTARIANWGRPHANVWERNGIKLDTKLQKAMDLVSQSRDNYYFTISTKPTEVYANQHLKPAH